MACFSYLDGKQLPCFLFTFSLWDKVTTGGKAVMRLACADCMVKISQLETNSCMGGRASIQILLEE
jgi:hypothetical protein